VRTSSTYVPKLSRWQHQEKALNAINGADAFALFMEMRTGKTKVILDEYGEHEQRGEIKNLLVVAPAGAYRTWEVDAEKHLSDDLKRRVKIVRWESKATSKVKRDLEHVLRTSGPKIFLVNIEALSTVETAQKLCAVLLRNAPTTMVVDESTVIKNISARRTKFCLIAAKYAKKRRILSGLPSPQSPLDLYAQCAFLGDTVLGGESFKRFRERYAILSRKPFGPGGRLIDVIEGYQNLKELSARIAPHAFRVKLDECYDMPPKVYLQREIELTDEQSRLYEEMKEYATALLENGERVTATIVLTQMLRLHQILAGYGKDDVGGATDIPERKTDEMLNVLEDYKGKAVIWAAYDNDIKKITKKLEGVYGKGSVARFWGGNADTREDEEALFKNDPRCRFMVATAASGGRGRTWGVADLVIYYNNTFSLEHRMQSEERAQLVGKKTSVAYVDLIYHDTIETKILEALRNKMSLSDAVTGDKWKAWVV
jgi:SNF2 family DNA or RNA helicase